MARFVEDGPNVVLDLGCATGKFGSYLIENGKASILEGVEIYRPAAEEAAITYRRVHVGDIEQLSLSYDTEFDYVICGDILEHLKDPYHLLRRILHWLRPGGAVLVCLPNIRNYSILYDLAVCGEWRYVSAGILDLTHLRFFTRKSCTRMLESAGFTIAHQQMIVEGSRKQFFRRMTLGMFDEFLASQIFVCGKKPL
jgi:2-polyprenyl-3-methyl-5-hydroxy-6-metoxy-1,4-benzoquinol methylase